MTTPHFTLLTHHKKRHHYLLVGGLLDVLEHTLVRPLPSLVAASITLGVYGIVIGIALAYTYRVQDLDILVYSYTLGYIIGCIYEYLRAITKMR